MSQILVRIVSRYAPIITFPVAVILGIVGYNIESILSSKKTPPLQTSIIEEREKRLLAELNGVLDTSSKSQNIFDKNDASMLK